MASDATTTPIGPSEAPAPDEPTGLCEPAGPGEAIDLVVVANRLPVEFSGDPPVWHTSSVGLVSALESALAGERAAGIGWSGQVDEAARVGEPLPESIDALRRAADGVHSAVLFAGPDTLVALLRSLLTQRARLPA